ncbi:hypothetical protein CA54_20580 [Symmachiella macrocystis]|uniref:Uncharacterized protein n=1 Tax=Symmachiella macrocystis TaxID=2527985 RepID=A0A5C6BPS9_9PLAN|nr:hypothetical protein CA54_20580 [Symmachiella macrocystis]
MAVASIGVTADDTVVLGVDTAVDIGVGLAVDVVVVTGAGRIVDDMAVDITVADVVLNRQPATARARRAESYDSVTPS